MESKEMVGLKTDLTNEQYHATSAVSKSMLDLIHVAPALVQWSKNAPVDTSKQGAFNIGTAVHAAILEPDYFAGMYVAEPICNKATKEGKAIAAKFAEENFGKIVTSSENYKLITMARDSALAHPTFKKIYDCEKLCEASIFWNHNDVNCKCRPDLLMKSRPLVVDVKTTSDIKWFYKSVFDYRYHVQDQHYSDGVSREYGGEVCVFYFLAISTSFSGGRIPVHLFELNDKDKELGLRERDADIESFKWCRDNNSWPGIEPISLPNWVK
jgi:exodeoxyribonuclease VIII